MSGVGNAIETTHGETGSRPRIAAALSQAAMQTDAICLEVGSSLCGAVPILDQLSTRFGALSAALSTGPMAVAFGELEGIVEDVAGIGKGLVLDGQTLASLIKQNETLSRQIGIVTEEVRFLATMVTSVKVEVAYLQGHDGLQGFEVDLARLTSKAVTTIERYQTTHDALLAKLREAARVYAEFEHTRRQALVNATSQIEQSLTAIAARRVSAVAATAEVGSNSEAIGSQIGQAVIALQIGDATHQRVAHSSNALSTTHADKAWPDLSEEDAELATRQVLRLQATQLRASANEFSREIGRTLSSLEGLKAATSALQTAGARLLTLRDGSTESFLGDLELRLGAANRLIEDYRRSRTTVDQLTAATIATFADLESLGASVGAIAIDMTIIGTNAIIRSFRLGQRGAGLSAISQQLRLQSVTISEKIKVLRPSLRDALDAAKAFAEALDLHGASRVARLGDKVGAVLASFKEVGTTIDASAHALGNDCGIINATLAKAIDDLHHVDGVTASLQGMATELDAHGRSKITAVPSATVDRAVDERLMPLYTMQAERQIHDAFFGRQSQVAEAVEPDLDVLFL